MPTHRPDFSDLSTQSLADLVGKAHRTVHKLLRAAGVAPVREDGRTLYRHPATALLAIYGNGNGLHPAAEKARLDRARAETAELALRHRRGEFARSRGRSLDVERPRALVEGAPTRASRSSARTRSGLRQGDGAPAREARRRDAGRAGRRQAHAAIPASPREGEAVIADEREPQLDALLVPRCSVATAARYFGRSKRWVQREIKDGRIPAIDTAPTVASRPCWSIALHDIRALVARYDMQAQRRVAEAAAKETSA